MGSTGYKCQDPNNCDKTYTDPKDGNTNYDIVCEGEIGAKCTLTGNECNAAFGY